MLLNIINTLCLVSIAVCLIVFPTIFLVMFKKYTQRIIAIMLKEDENEI